MVKKYAEPLLSIEVKQESELPAVAKAIRKAAGDHSIWIFEGEMGAGKTTLIKSIARDYGIVGQVSSPTFSIINEYENADGDVFYHFDFYRIEQEKEASDIGVEEYFDSGDICWIEWAARIPNLLPETYLLIEIQPQPDQSRVISVSTHD